MARIWWVIDGPGHAHYRRAYGRKRNAESQLNAMRRAGYECRLTEVIGRDAALKAERRLKGESR